MASIDGRQSGSQTVLNHLGSFQDLLTGSLSRNWLPARSLACWQRCCISERGREGGGERGGGEGVGRKAVRLAFVEPWVGEPRQRSHSQDHCGADLSDWTPQWAALGCVCTSGHVSGGVRCRGLLAWVGPRAPVSTSVSLSVGPRGPWHPFLYVCVSRWVSCLTL